MFLALGVQVIQSCATAADYVKGTTTSRMMVWFGYSSAFCSLHPPLLGLGAAVWLPLWETPLFTFAGMGSVLLTAGPAYKEYKEVTQASAA